MPRKRTPSAPRGQTTQSRRCTDPTWQRAAMLVGQLIALLEQTVHAAGSDAELRQQMMGQKDGTIAQLQKLVDVLGVIQDRLDASAIDNAAGGESALPNLAPEDMAIIARWAEQELQALQGAITENS